MTHAAAHRDGHKGDVLSVSSAEFRRMEQDRASVKRVLLLAEDLGGAVMGHPEIAKLIRDAVAGPQ